MIDEPSPPQQDKQPEDSIRFSAAFQSFLVFLLFLGLALVLHHEGFGSPMIYDSDGWIRGKAHIFARDDPLEVMSIVPMRPLFMMSLYGNYRLTGLDPAAFRVFNAAILAASALMLVLLMVLLLETPEFGVPGTRLEKRGVALFLGLWFVVHPLQTFVVLYIWQREAIMACLFFFSALAAYVAARKGKFRSATAGYGLVGVLFFAGILSKENLATLPVMLVLAELTLFRSNFRQLMKRCVTIAAIFVPLFVVYFVLTNSLYSAETVHQHGVLGRLLDYYEKSSLTPTQVLLTECRITFEYLLMIVAPFLHPMQLVKAQTVSVSLWNPRVTARAFLGVISLIATGIALMRRQPLAAFGIFFFFVTLAPESLLIPQYLFFGYRPILPMAGVLMVLGSVVCTILEQGAARLPKRFLQSAVALLLVVPLVCFSIMTVAQARRWDPVFFWQGACAHLPRFSEHVETMTYRVILVNMGAVLINVGEYREALKVLRKAESVDPDSPVIQLNLGLALSRTGQTDQAIETLRKAVRTNPEIPAGWLLLGQIFMDQGNKAEGIAHLRKGVQLNPRDAVARRKLTNALVDSGNIEEALKILRNAVQVDPRDIEAHMDLGQLLMQSGNATEAIEHFQQVLAIQPDHARARMNLEKLMHDKRMHR